MIWSLGSRFIFIVWATPKKTLEIDFCLFIYNYLNEFVEANCEWNKNDLIFVLKIRHKELGCSLSNVQIQSKYILCRQYLLIDLYDSHFTGKMYLFSMSLLGSFSFYVAAEVDISVAITCFFKDYLRDLKFKSCLISYP